MLHLELNAFDSLAGPYYRYRGTIENLAGGRLADYRIVLEDEQQQVLARTRLDGYARWSEPLTGFVARSIR